MNSLNKTKAILIFLAVGILFFQGCTSTTTNDTTTTTQSLQTTTLAPAETTTIPVQTTTTTLPVASTTTATTATTTTIAATSTTTAGPKTVNVDISNFAFNPSDLKINVGDTVTWTNNDPVPHTVTSDSGSELSSPTLATGGGTYSHTFQSKGVFAYHCSIHLSMTASVTVQ